MNQKYVGAAIALGVAYAVFKFSKNTNVKSAALGVMGTVVAQQIPYVQNAFAGAASA